MIMWKDLLVQIQQGDIKALARSISLVENEQPGYEKLLQLLPSNQQTKIIGITGPPGAGKSTLVDSLIGLLVESGKRIAVLCVDPSSPFNFGALLGDRIRMSEWYTHPKVFIRSIATRGSMGGLNSKIIELTDQLKAAGYDPMAAARFWTRFGKKTGAGIFSDGTHLRTRDRVRLLTDEAAKLAQ